MNELIREVWIKAAESTKDDSWQSQTEFMERFAKLIVGECSSVIEDAVNHREPASTYVDKIKEHFGLE